MKRNRIYLLFMFFVLIRLSTQAQPVPAPEENIPFLMTFGNQADPSWGDDDFSLVFFFSVPPDYNDPLYIRVFDPDIGGDIDEVNDEFNVGFNTRMSYDIYGGAGAHSDEDAQGDQPTGNYRSGNLLASKIFGEDPLYDNNWYTFGPFNPTEGEYEEEFDLYVFKIIVEGISGDDGNLFRFFLSSEPEDNVPIEGGNAFTYEYSFRLWNNPNNISHIYPYIDDETISVRQSNFDWDDDGLIRTVSVIRNSHLNDVSGDDVWVESEMVIQEEEKNTSLDFQFIKKKTGGVVRNNNVVISVKNQYNVTLPFYTVPIGGVPKYKYAIQVKKKEGQ